MPSKTDTSIALAAAAVVGFVSGLAVPEVDSAANLTEEQVQFIVAASQNTGLGELTRARGIAERSFLAAEHLYYTGKGSFADMKDAKLAFEKALVAEQARRSVLAEARKKADDMKNPP